MDLLFKNTTIYSKKIYDEFLEFHKNKYKYSYTLYTALIILAFLFCMGMQLKYHNYTLAIIFVFCIICFFSWRYFRPISQVVKDYNSDVIQKEKEFSFYFYEKNFVIKYKNSSCSFKYTTLYRVLETKNFFYLYVDKNHSYLIDKKGFSIGKPEEFSKFIKKKKFIIFANKYLTNYIFMI